MKPKSQLHSMVAMIVVQIGMIACLESVLAQAHVAKSTEAKSYEQAKPTQTKVEGPGGLPIIVRMQGPYDADVPLQIVCYFEYTPTSDAKLFGAPVELDQRLGGLIASLRQRGEFQGLALESLLIEPPSGTIKAKRLLLLGLGAESELSLDRMEAIGRVAIREAAKIGAKSVAFAPMIKDAGNDSLDAGEVETSVVRGMLMAYDTEKRLQKQGLRAAYVLDEWIVESGPAYFDSTVVGVKKAVLQANETIAKRQSSAYSSKSK